MNDNQFIDERIIEDINNLINNGYIYGLPYNPEE